MTQTTRQTLIGALGIVAIGLVVGLANNLQAGPARRLDWIGAYPPKGEPPCRKVAQDGAASPAHEIAAATRPAADPGQPTPAPAADPGQPTPASGADPGQPTPAPAVDPGQPTPAPGLGPAPATSVEIPPVPFGTPWIELAPAQVKELFDRGALFVDARKTSLYEEGHVAGAMSIPIWQSGVAEKVQQVMFAPQVQGDPGAPIVSYCGGGDCEDSHMVSQKLSDAGHLAVYVYKDGFPNWKERGWPISHGSAP